MQIKIRVVTNAKKERITQERNIYKIHVSVPPEKGRANDRVVELIARFFKISKSQIKIVKGLKSKGKTIVVNL